MEQKPQPPKTAAELREERLKAALKANLAKRKAQARAKRSAQAIGTGQGADTDPE